MFHALRRQLKWEFRKPLINMAPKSLLRHPLVVSDLKEFTNGRFQEVIDDANVDAKKVKRVLFCTGKVYYDLFEEQKTAKRTDVAIVRVEQLYPYPEKQMEAIFAKYKNAEYVWVQEEPYNMGAWGYILRRMYLMNNTQIEVIARDEASSPAVGYLKAHIEKQAELVKRSFADKIEKMNIR
jgi:2-oxoglutarate dehydrogenase E1 component